MQNSNSGLDVADVDHPEARHAVLVGFRQFVADEGGRDGAEPDVGTGIAQVAEMVVDAVSAAPFPFLCRWQLADEGVVVVNPAHRHVVGNPQSRIVEGEGFLVGDVDLWHFRGVAAQGVGDDFALGGDDVGQSLQLSRLSVVAEQGNVLQSAHADVVDALVAACLAGAFGPIVVATLRIGGKREVAAVVARLEARPLPEVVAQHAVARTHDYRPCFRQSLVLFQRPKGFRAAVLSRPEAVGTQAEQKLHDFLVRARAYIIICSVDGLPRPREHGPVFVVDEESAVLHGRFLYGGSVALDIDGGHGGGCDVGPPNVGRDADAAAYLEESVGRAARGSAHDDEGLADAFGRVLHELERVGFPNARQTRGIDLAGGNKRVNGS